MYTVEEYDKQKTKVLKYIIYKKRTEREVIQKFSKTIDANMLEDIVEELKQNGYINDKEYIGKAVHNFIILKNLSLKELRYKLLSKGLQEYLIEDYFHENEEELQQYEEKSAYNILLKKQDMMEQDEIKQYLLKKGYKIENINLALEEVGK